MRKRIIRSGLPGLLRRLVRSRAGTVTVEFVIWMPVFVFILALTADACKLYLTQADMFNVARDTARRMSTGQLVTTADAEAYASDKLLYSSLGYTFNITKDTDSTTHVTDDTVEIGVPAMDASVFGLLPVIGNFKNAQVRATIVMRDETESAT
jgi:Flp pilus assembly protein TadG